MDRVFLIACSAGKIKADLVPARDLYNSQLFTLARSYAEMSSDPWFILSAKFGLLDPARLVAPYDESLNDKRSTERADWVRTVKSQLKERLLRSVELVMLAGRAYRDPLQHLLETQGHIITVPNDINSTAIVRSILAMAGHLNLRVIAEGIETFEQVHFLENNGDPFMQGYFFCRPMPLVDLIVHFNRVLT